jgi:hypothetical protein
VEDVVANRRLKTLEEPASFAQILLTDALGRFEPLPGPVDVLLRHRRGRSQGVGWPAAA